MHMCCCGVVVARVSNLHCLVPGKQAWQRREKGFHQSLNHPLDSITLVHESDSMPRCAWRGTATDIRKWPLSHVRQGAQTFLSCAVADSTRYPGLPHRATERPRGGPRIRDSRRPFPSTCHAHTLSRCHTRRCGAGLPCNLVPAKHNSFAARRPLEDKPDTTLDARRTLCRDLSTLASFGSLHAMAIRTPCSVIGRGLVAAQRSATVG